MAKLIPMPEAAKMLGMSPAELTELRSRGEITGYRDGSSWKFKEAEIQRLAETKGISLHDNEPAETLSDDQSDELVDLSEPADEGGSDSILISEESLGHSDESTASTIIGDLSAEDEGSELRLARSDVLAGDSDTPKEPDAGDTANLQAAASSDLAEDLKLEDSGSVDLSLEDSSLGSADLDAQASSSGFGSAIDLDLDDDELVLGSNVGSDVTGSSADSGINLTNPSDSGISLEEPLELTGDSGAESLELGEDDLVELDEAALSEEGGDDFLLTPVEEGADDESSGSQVIALDSEEFDESAAILEEGEGLEAEPVAFEEAEAPVALAAGATAMAGDAAQYTTWNVLSLLTIVLLLGFTGMLMLDVMHNIWSWQGTSRFSSTIMDGILQMLS